MKIQNYLMTVVNLIVPHRLFVRGVQLVQFYPSIFDEDLNYNHQFLELPLNHGQICKDLHSSI